MELGEKARDARVGEVVEGVECGCKRGQFRDGGRDGGGWGGAGELKRENLATEGESKCCVGDAGERPSFSPMRIPVGEPLTSGMGSTAD